MHKKLFLADFLVSILVASGFILVNALPFGTVQASTTVIVIASIQAVTLAFVLKKKR